MMDCKAARLLLEFSRPAPAELEAGEADALASHLADCPDCDAVHQAESAIDARIGRAMRDVPVPADLRGKLLARLATDKDVWYRRRLLRVAAVAACIAILATLGHIVWNYRPPVDLTYARTLEAPQSAEDVEKWFKDQVKVDMTAPQQFNYALLAYWGMGVYQGKQVPLLVFSNGTEMASIYILSSRQFNLESLGNTPDGLSGRFNVQVLGYLPGDPYAYVAVYTNLRPFLIRPSTPA